MTLSKTRTADRVIQKGGLYLCVRSVFICTEPGKPDRLIQQVVSSFHPERENGQGGREAAIQECDQLQAKAESLRNRREIDERAFYRSLGAQKSQPVAP